MTPVCLAFQPGQERLIGDSCINQLRRNLKNSILYPTRFLGLTSQCQEQLTRELKFITNDTTFDQLSDRIKISLINDNEVNYEAIVAAYLNKLHQFYEQQGYQTRDIVLTVPSYASVMEKQAL